jgi:hypothetical protein
MALPTVIERYFAALGAVLIGVEDVERYAPKDGLFVDGRAYHSESTVSCTV